MAHRRLDIALIGVPFLAGDEFGPLIRLDDDFRIVLVVAATLGVLGRTFT